MNNDIEVMDNAEFCLVYDQPVPAEGLQFSLLASRRGVTEVNLSGSSS